MKVLIDSDILFSLFNPLDVNHTKASKIFQKLLVNKREFWVTNLVLQESATLVSNKLSHKDALTFLERFWQINIKVLFVSEKLTGKSWEVFKQQPKNKISFIDCANVVIFKELTFNKLFSFDKFYQKFGLSIQN